VCTAACTGISYGDAVYRSENGGIDCLY